MESQPWAARRRASQFSWLIIATLIGVPPLVVGWRATLSLDSLMLGLVSGVMTFVICAAIIHPMARTTRRSGY